jgi:hypothetical protein
MDNNRDTGNIVTENRRDNQEWTTTETQATLLQKTEFKGQSRMNNPATQATLFQKIEFKGQSTRGSAHLSFCFEET